MRLSFAILALGISVSLHASCMSDFDCGIGYVCAKKPYSSNGVCMKSVNEYGVQQYNMPSMDSVGKQRRWHVCYWLYTRDTSNACGACDGAQR